MHPGSRGRNCAKGPATLNQVEDPERILYPLRRKGPRGGGQWERVTWDEVLDDIGGRIRKALRRGAPEGGHVPPRPARPRAGLPAARVPRLGHRRPQQPHQRVLGQRARRLRLLARDGPALAGSRQRALHPAAVLAPGDRPLLQSARPAHHRGQDARRQGRRHRLAPEQHRLDGRLLAGAVAGLRGRDAAGHGPRAHPREPLRPRLRAALGQLGGVPARGAPGPAGDLRRVPPGARRAVRLVHAGVRREGKRRRSRHHRERRARGRRRRLGAGHPHLAQHRGRQPRRLAGGARAGAAGGAGRRGQHARAAPRPAPGTRRSRRRR